MGWKCNVRHYNSVALLGSCFAQHTKPKGAAKHFRLELDRATDVEGVVVKWQADRPLSIFGDVFSFMYVEKKCIPTHSQVYENPDGDSAETK